VAGGVALNEGLVDMLSGEMGSSVLVPDDPQTTAALGAAVLAKESVAKGLR